jgi:MoxR-like ATPase
LSFKRIQFTPDLLPADLTGTLIYNPKIQEFQTKKGPIFANIILADEINRAPAKVQSALLEAMQEQQVTIGETTYEIEKPFTVLATQNPIEHEGTYQLPEAQVDRFMLKLKTTYPSYQEEKEVLRKHFLQESLLPIISKKELSHTKEIVKSIYIDEKVVDYILKIVFATRFPSKYNMAELEQVIEYGASTRASLSIHKACRALAFIKNRNFVIPDDVKDIVPSVLRHRIILSHEAESDNVTSEKVVEQILNKIPSP